VHLSLDDFFPFIYFFIHFRRNCISDPGPFDSRFFFLIYFLFYSFQKINIFSDLGPFCHPEPQGFFINLIFISDPGPLVELSLWVFFNFLFLVFNLFNPLILTRTLALLWDRISFFFNFIYLFIHFKKLIFSRTRALLST